MPKIKEYLKRNSGKLSKLIILLISALGTYGICYLGSLIMGNKFSYSIFSVAIFICIYILLDQTQKNLQKLNSSKEKKKRIIWSIILAYVFAVLMIIGYQLKVFGMTEGGVRGKTLILIRGFALLFSVFPFTNYFFYIVEKIKTDKKSEPEKKPWKSKKVFLFSWIMIFVLWIPVFLAYYPAVMAHDFHRQSQEAVRGFIWFNSYQPLAHTWLIWLFFQIGNLFDSYEIGMAFYSIFQMLVFSVASGYSCSMIYRFTKKKWAPVVTGVFFGIYPIISVLAVSVTKDIIFSALFLVFMCLFAERQYFSSPKKQVVIDILWFLDGVLMILFRNNAVYALAVFAIVYLIVAEKKQKIRIVIFCILLSIAGKGALEGVQLAIGTSIRGSKIEMYNVPIQQFARVGHNHQSELDAETYELLNTYVPEELWGSYNPPIGDGVRLCMGNVYVATWKGQMSDVFEAWLQIGLKYPEDYIDAFLLLTAGYWSFDDTSWAEVLGYGLEGRMGAVYTYTSSTSEVIPEGIAHESKFPWLEQRLEEIVSANCFYNWPIISVLFQMATYCWALMLTLLACFYIKDRKKASIVLLPVVYLATMFLGPVVLSRYVLPIIMVVPLMAAMLSYREKKN